MLLWMRLIKAPLSQLCWLKSSHAGSKVSGENRGKIILALISRGARKLPNDSVASEQRFASTPPEEEMLAGRDSMT